MLHALKKSGAGLAFLLAAIWFPTGHADDWPQWRGPARDGVWHETGILKTFPPEGLTVRWRAAIGPGWSSPSVALGRVYLVDSELHNPKANERVRCFDEATGKPLWTHSYEVSYPDWAFPNAGRGPTATPLVHDGKLYTVGNKGDLFCLDAVKGDVLWQKNLETEYKVQEFAFNSSPLIEDKLLILCIGSYPASSVSCTLAMDKDTGREVWKTPNKGLTNSAPIVLSAGGKRQLIVWTQKSVVALDPARGTFYWEEFMDTEAQNAVATPVVRENLLLVSGLMLKLDADKPDATVLWPESKALSRRVLSNTSTPLIQDGHVYSAKSSGEFVCLELATGKEVWKTDTVTGLRSGASVHITPNGNAVFLFTDQGDLIRAQLSAVGYKELSRTRLLTPVGKEKAWQSPAYANRNVYVRNDAELICASLAAKP